MKDRNGNVLQGISAQGKISKRMYYYKSKTGLVKFQKPVSKVTQKLLGFRNISKLNYENALSINENHNNSINNRKV